MVTSKGTVFDGRRYEVLSDLELPNVLQDVVAKKCQFVACQYGMTARATSERRRVRNVSLVDCKATNNTWLGSVIVEDVDVKNLATAGVCIAWGAAFRHVKVSGKCGKFMLSPMPSTDSRREIFEAANAQFYQTVDWALDISEAEFEEMDIRSVPADLVRRDPETQVIVRKERVEATQDIWRNLDLSGSPWRGSLTNMLEWGLVDAVLVAPKRRKDFRAWLEGLKRLQKAGVAEPG